MSTIRDLQQHQKEMLTRIGRSAKLVQASRLFVYDDYKIIVHDKTGRCKQLLDQYLQAGDRLDIEYVDNVEQLRGSGKTVAVYFIDSLNSDEIQALIDLAKNNKLIVVNINGFKLPNQIRQAALNIVEHPTVAEDVLSEVTKCLDKVG